MPTRYRGSMDDRERFELEALILDMAREQGLGGLLDLCVRRLAQRDKIALARIWLLEPGDLCAECRLAEECEDRTACLHLVASAGNPSHPDPGTGELPDWGRSIRLCAHLG